MSDQHPEFLERRTAERRKGYQDGSDKTMREAANRRSPATKQEKAMTEKTERGELVRDMERVVSRLVACYGINSKEANTARAAIAALSAQQAGEPVPAGWYDLDYEVSWGAKKPGIAGTWKPLYFAPPSGVRDGMLRAAEICEEIAATYDTQARRLKHGTQARITIEDCYVGAMACVNAIRAASAQVNAEGRPTRLQGPELSGCAAPSAPPSAPQTVVDTCDQGHKFAKLPDHPKRNSKARCPHCMAIGLDATRQPQTVRVHEVWESSSEVTVNDEGNVFTAGIDFGPSVWGNRIQCHANTENEAIELRDTVLNAMLRTAQESGK